VIFTSLLLTVFVRSSVVLFAMATVNVIILILMASTFLEYGSGKYVVTWYYGNGVCSTAGIANGGLAGIALDIDAYVDAVVSKSDTPGVACTPYGDGSVLINRGDCAIDYYLTADCSGTPESSGPLFRARGCSDEVEELLPLLMDNVGGSTVAECLDVLPDCIYLTIGGYTETFCGDYVRDWTCMTAAEVDAMRGDGTNQTRCDADCPDIEYPTCNSARTLTLGCLEDCSDEFVAGWGKWKYGCDCLLRKPGYNPTLSPEEMAATPAPTAKKRIEVCIDVDLGVADVAGAQCVEYAYRYTWCGKYDDDDFSAQFMCCACQGGEVCADNDGTAYDASFDGCDGYHTHTYWCTKFDDDDFSAADMCCPCGGGMADSRMVGGSSGRGEEKDDLLWVPDVVSTIQGLMDKSSEMTYRMQQYGVDGCEQSRGDIVDDIDECRAAIYQLEIDIVGTWTESDLEIPRFCSVRDRADAEAAGGFTMAHFNLASSGQGRDDLAPICKYPDAYLKWAKQPPIFMPNISTAESFDERALKRREEFWTSCMVLVFGGTVIWGTVMLKLLVPCVRFIKKCRDVEMDDDSKVQKYKLRYCGKRAYVSVVFVIYYVAILSAVGIAVMKDTVSQQYGMPWEVYFFLLTGSCISVLVQATALVFTTPGRYSWKTFLFGSITAFLPFYSDPFDTFKDIQFGGMCLASQDWKLFILGICSIFYVFVFHMCFIHSKRRADLVLELSNSYGSVLFAATVRGKTEDDQAYDPPQGILSRLRNADGIVDRFCLALWFVAVKLRAIILPVLRALQKQTSPAKFRFILFEDIPQSMFAVAYLFIRASDPTAAFTKDGSPIVVVFNILFPWFRLLFNMLMRKRLKGMVLQLMISELNSALYDRNEIKFEALLEGLKDEPQALVKAIVPRLEKLKNEEWKDAPGWFLQVVMDHRAEAVDFFLERFSGTTLKVGAGNPLGISGSMSNGSSFQKARTTALSMASTLGENGEKVTDSTAIALAVALKHDGTLEKLDLSYTDVADAGLKELAKAMKVNGILTELDLSFTKVADASMDDFAEMLQENKCLVYLNLSGTNVSDFGAKKLASALELNRDLKKLNLSQTKVGDDGAKALASVLQVDKGLQELILFETEVSKYGVTHLIVAIKYNKTLVYLTVDASTVRRCGDFEDLKDDDWDKILGKCYDDGMQTIINIAQIKTVAAEAKATAALSSKNVMQLRMAFEECRHSSVDEGLKDRLEAAIYGIKENSARASLIDALGQPTVQRLCFAIEECKKMEIEDGRLDAAHDTLRNLAAAQDSTHAQIAPMLIGRYSKYGFAHKGSLYCSRYFGNRPGKVLFCAPHRGQCTNCQREQERFPNEDIMNDNGAKLTQGLDGMAYYCGGFINFTKRCGPLEGPQCGSCVRYQRTIQKIFNDERALMLMGADGETYYCGRFLGVDLIPGSVEGYCGPASGPQCESCMRYQS